METLTDNLSLKGQSIGWLLGRLLSFCHTVIKTLANNPEHKELVNEAKWLLKRWEVERKIK